MSVVPISDVSEECCIGEECRVKVGRKHFSGKVAAIGKKD